VIDLLMPEVDGEALLHALRARCRELPVVLASGCAADGAGDRVAAVGARFLAKPWSSEALRAAVAAALAESRAATARSDGHPPAAALLG
jgi:FixJ family two-component response regulator